MPVSEKCTSSSSIYIRKTAFDSYFIPLRGAHILTKLPTYQVSE